MSSRVIATLVSLLLHSTTFAQGNHATHNTTTNVNRVTAEPTTESWSYTPQTRIGRYLVSVPTLLRPGERVPLVVFLHGNGNTPQMMMNLAKEMDLGKVVVVCPEAPYMKIPETIEARDERYSAMLLGSGAPDSLQKTVIDFSATWYQNVVQDARHTLPVDTTQGVRLIGFSQGGFFGHVLLTRFPQTYSHVATICASMYAAGDVVDRYQSVHPHAPIVLVAHGLQDEIVPFQTGELIHSQLSRAGVQHTWLPFQGGHWPTPTVLEAIKAMMR